MSTPELTIYVDSTCGFCVAEVDMLKRHDRLGALAFVDLAAPGFAAFPPGTDLATLNARLHAVTADGRVLTGLDSMQAIYRLVGLGWVVWPLRIRPLRPLMAWCYELFARHRYRVSDFFGMRATPAERCDGATCHPGSPFTKACAMNEGIMSDGTRGAPVLSLYYDGACAFCTSAMLALRRHDRHGALAFVDIAAPGFADFPPGTDMAALNARVHAVTADGRVLSGLDSMQAAYSLVGMGWAVLPLRVRPLRPALAWAYDRFARNRYRISRLLGMRLPEPRCDGDTCYRGSPFLKGLRDD